MRPNPGKAILGGFVGTVVMTLMMYFVAPMMLGGPMDVAGMLGGVLGGSWMMGMLMHLLNGIVIFPLIYAYFLFRVLPGDPWAKGTILGLILWFLSQAVVTPMMGGGMFSAKAGGLMAVMASLIAHIIYGALLGVLAGAAEGSSASPRVQAAR
ncbi:MAG: hypothetical protein HY725_10115 [Candidatus Rokubacteria bacterium]|nr:hypothetical protein [Candidatus Rokubacteria bacterium]